MRFVNVTHNDLDGVTCGILVKKFCDEKNIDLETISANYGEIPEIFYSVIATTKEKNEKLNLIITDLNVRKEVLEKILSHECVYSVVFIDHHEKEDDLDFEELKRRFPNKKFYYNWNKEKCGASLTKEFLEKHGGIKYTPEMEKLVYFTNLYDVWQSTHKDFPIALKLNDIYWHNTKEKFDIFFKNFADGYDWTDEYEKLAKEIANVRDSFFEEVEEYSEVVNLPKKQKCRMVFHPDNRYTNFFGLKYDEDIFFIFVRQNNGSNIFSIRLKSVEHIKANYIAATVGNALGGDGGGHSKAAGFHCPADVELEQIVSTFLDVVETTLKGDLTDF